MKQILLLLLTAFIVNAATAQTDTTAAAPVQGYSADLKPRRNLSLTGRSADHFMLQLGYLTWQNRPDSINTKGLPRTFNLHLLFDFPFKTNPHLSVAIGVGIGTDHMFFENETRITIKENELRFRTDTFFRTSKYKLTTGYLEAPLELRYASRPEDMNRSFKVALGVKIGTMIDAHTKAKVDRDEDNFGGYVLKEKSRTNFNTTRLAGTFRVGYGAFSLFATYQFNEYIKEGRGPSDIRPLSIGLTLSGL